MNNKLIKHPMGILFIMIILFFYIGLFLVTRKEQVLALIPNKNCYIFSDNTNDHIIFKYIFYPLVVLTSSTSYYPNSQEHRLYFMGRIYELENIKGGFDRADYEESVEILKQIDGKPLGSYTSESPQDSGGQ